MSEEMRAEILGNVLKNYLLHEEAVTALVTHSPRMTFLAEPGDHVGFPSAFGVVDKPMGSAKVKLASVEYESVIEVMGDGTLTPAKFVDAVALIYLDRERAKLVVSSIARTFPGLIDEALKE